jgi:protein transport protein YIF1
LCGYKYVLLCIGVLIAQALPPGRLYSGLVMLYGLLAHSFFTLRVISLRHVRDDSRVPPRSRVFTYACAAAQIPTFVWMFVRPLYTSE